MKLGDLVEFTLVEGPPPAPSYSEIYGTRTPGLLIKLLRARTWLVLWRNGDRNFEHDSYLRVVDTTEESI